MKKFLIGLILACAALTFAPHTSAASGFNAGRIIDDSVFTNKSTMSVDAIQSFLNSKVTACDTNGNQQSEMNNSGVPDYNGNGSIQRWEWGKYKYNQTTFPCLRDYKQDGVSAAQLIYNAAQTYSINPQVLIVLLQKEQGLVTDTWPLNVQYRSATGYGCPDTAACDSKYYGLKNQIDWASKMFRAILDNSPNWYTPYVLGNNYIQYNPNSSCGGSTVNIQNRSTQALYNYTPYQPNQAALDAGWGTANCGAYGNRNFHLYFTSWFGSSSIQILASFAERYAELGGKDGVLGEPTSNQVCGLPNEGCFQGFQKGGIYWSPKSGTFESYGKIRDRYVEMGADRSSLGYPNEGVICGLPSGGCYQRYQNGVLYLSPTAGKAFENSGQIRERFKALGAESGILGYPDSTIHCKLINGGCYQGYQNGAIYWSASTGARENLGQIRQRYLASGTENGAHGYPTTNQVCSTGTNQRCYQMFESGGIYYSSTTGAKSVWGGIYNKWNSLQKEWGALGYPATNELYGLKDNASYQEFEGGSIYWTKNGGRIVLNSIYTRWNELGKENGKLGYPTNDTVCGTKNNGCYQTFSNGNTIYWSSSTGAKTVWGAIYSAWDKNQKEWGKLGYPISNEYYEGNVARQDFQGGSIQWSTTNGAQIIYK
jgi:uncharacterized protein with LGFP repeats